MNAYSFTYPLLNSNFSPEQKIPLTFSIPNNAAPVKFLSAENVYDSKLPETLRKLFEKYDECSRCQNWNSLMRLPEIPRVPMLRDSMIKIFAKSVRIKISAGNFVS